MVDFSRAALAARACIDPWALAAQVQGGDPDTVRGMGVGFRDAWGVAGEAAGVGRAADASMGSAYLADGAEVFDAAASTAEGRTLLSDDGELMEEVARTLIAVGDRLGEAIDEVGVQIRALASDITDTIEARNNWMADNAAVLTAESAAAADETFFAQAVERVVARGGLVRAQVDGYDAELATRMGHLREFGYEAPPPPPPEKSWQDNVAGFGSDVLGGIGNAASGTVESLGELNPLRLLEDPGSYGEDLARYAGGVGQLANGLATDPLRTLDEVFAGGNVGRGHPGTAVGETIGGILAGGIVGKLTKLGHLDNLAPDRPNNSNYSDTPASSANSWIDLNRQLRAEEIANGHAWEKHVIKKGEFPEIQTKEEFAAHVENVMRNGEEVLLGNDDIAPELRRVVYWLDDTIVFSNPLDPKGGGTAFRPDEGYEYFLEVTSK